MTDTPPALLELETILAHRVLTAPTDFKHEWLTHLQAIQSLISSIEYGTPWRNNPTN